MSWLEAPQSTASASAAAGELSEAVNKRGEHLPQWSLVLDWNLQVRGTRNTILLRRP